MPTAPRHVPPLAAIVLLAVAAALAIATTPATAAVEVGAARAPGDFHVPVEYYRLANGLRVVLSPDRTAPIATVAVYYHVGFRNEPQGRTGFAHLFEHMMFQGSPNLRKGEFDRLIHSNGGTNNGSTRYDFTNYWEVIPAHALEPILWAEADRMRGVALTEENLRNQRDVVKNEVRVNVLNAPYGGFPWLDLPQVAYENWYNAHNFYGEFGDLDAATLEELQAFFETFYAPNNAALVVVGDIDLDQTRAWIEKYFAAIEPSPLPPRPDISEPRQEREKRVVKRYPRAPRPGVAVGFHAPDREAPEYVALGVIDQVLGQGRDSRLYQRIVQEKGLAGDVSAYLNPFGHMFNVEGPALYTIEVLHDEQTTPDAILEVIDEEIARLQREPVDRPTLERALTKAKSSFYDTLESDANFGRADLLGSFALFFDDPARINTALDAFAAVTPELIQRTAREYLRPTNRTVLVAEPGPES